jgi:hypothetical protein
MQSMEILIVICQGRAAVQTGRTSQSALRTAQGQPGSAEFKMTVCKRVLQPKTRKKRRHANQVRCTAFMLQKKRRLLVVFGLDDFATTVETVRADVVTQVRFASGRLDSQVRGDEEIVRTVHAALGRGLLILLNCHDDS